MAVKTKDEDITIPPKPGSQPLVQGQQLAPQDPPKSNLPAELDYGAYEGAGMENLDPNELVVPFFSIIQQNSPQVNNAHAKYIKGAEAGMFLDTASLEVFQTFEAVFCHRAYNYVCYVPRDAGGGFKGIYAPNDPLVQRLLSKQGGFKRLSFVEPANPQAGEKGGPRELVETFYLFGVGGPLGSRPRRFMVGFKSTQIGRYKNWLSFVNQQLVYDHPDGGGRLVYPPMWAHRFKCSTAPESNDKGQFRGWKLELAGVTKEGSRVATTHPLFQEATMFYDFLRKGAAKVDFDQEAKAGTDTHEAAGAETF